jgi:hypothetical protein
MYWYHHQIAENGDKLVCGFSLLRKNLAFIWWIEIKDVSLHPKTYAHACVCM